MADQGLHTMATIIKRLEAATSRLEDIAASQATYTPTPQPAPPPPPPPPLSPALLAPLPPRPPPPPPPPQPVIPPTLDQFPPAVVAFDESVIAARVKPWVELSNSLEIPVLSEVATLVTKEYEELRNFLVLAGSCRRPEPHQMETLLTPIQGTIEVFTKVKDSNRRQREIFGHLQFASEIAVAVAWIIHDNPARYVKDVKESSDYYGNRVIKDYKEKDPRHVEWCRGLTAILDAVRDHANEFYKTGIFWNQSGPTVDEFRVPAEVPPPPPPPPELSIDTFSMAPPSAGGVAAVFAELNRGEEVTKGLRKVDKSEMTHKNPSLRAGHTVPGSPVSPGKKPARPMKPAALAGKKPPKFTLEGSKWLVENQENNAVITIEETSINQSINIYNCSNTTVIVKGKVNAVTLVRSAKTSVRVESVVSSISVTASPSFVVQVTGTAPMIQVDNTDSGQIYLSKDSLTAEITTAKCSAINVSLPVEGEEDGVFSEHPIPEMLRTVVKDGKLSTSFVEHSG